MIIQRSNVTRFVGFLFVSIIASSYGIAFAAGEVSRSANPVFPKYIFLFIGDGMGPVQRIATEQFVRNVPKNSRYYRSEGLIMNSLPIRGTTDTRSFDEPITDSAAAATAMACGVKTRNGAIGMDASNKPVENLSAIAAGMGKKVGIITSVAINGATPASFYAHIASRYHYNAIAKQIPASGVDFFGGGALTWDTKKAPVETIYQALADAGYRVAACFAQAQPEGFCVVCKER